uniref:Uncharacterized protein n=1 Tax=Nelumbo nucifera TaxID=4432 RepID=A0A822Y5J8_NELNU|nr:TPA_asm: hypothetical protein HUJ06_027783 [Nelumbo nucifera]
MDVAGNPGQSRVEGVITGARPRDQNVAKAIVCFLLINFWPVVVCIVLILLTFNEILYTVNDDKQSESLW